MKAVGNHWAIKNRLHRVLDVRMQADDFLNRTVRSPENLAGIGRLMLNILRLMDYKQSVRRRFLRAAQVPEYRLELIGNAAKLAETLRYAVRLMGC